MGPLWVRGFPELPHRVVHTSVTGAHSIVAEPGDDDWERIDGTHAWPVQFQALVPGFDRRAHTVRPDLLARATIPQQSTIDTLTMVPCLSDVSSSPYPIPDIPPLLLRDSYPLPIISPIR